MNGPCAEPLEAGPETDLLLFCGAGPCRPDDVNGRLFAADVLPCPAPLSERERKKRKSFIFRFRTPSGARTLDPNIKSVVLYQLS